MNYYSETQILYLNFAILYLREYWELDVVILIYGRPDIVLKSPQRDNDGSMLL